jgi:hypothetical protein
MHTTPQMLSGVQGCGIPLQPQPQNFYNINLAPKPNLRQDVPIMETSSIIHMPTVALPPETTSSVQGGQSLKSHYDLRPRTNRRPTVDIDADSRASSKQSQFTFTSYKSNAAQKKNTQIQHTYLNHSGHRPHHTYTFSTSSDESTEAARESNDDDQIGSVDHIHTSDQFIRRFQ